MTDSIVVWNIFGLLETQAIPIISNQSKVEAIAQDRKVAKATNS